MVQSKDSGSLEDLTFDEVNAILVHKWFLSQKEKRDVGMEYAKNDFFQHHAASWRKKRLEEDLHQQKEEIKKHKWFLSEKLGYDVGMTQAALDWIKNSYAEQWRNCTGPYKNRK